VNTEEIITEKTDVSTIKNTNPTMETCAGGEGCGCACVQVDTDNNVPKEEASKTEASKTEDGEVDKTEDGEVDKTEEGEEEIDRDVIKDLISIFDDVNFAYSLNDVIAELRELGYDNPGTIITLALQDDVIYVDSVEDSGTVYLAVVEQDEEE
jgi:hypothetical protein